MNAILKRQEWSLSSCSRQEEEQTHKGICVYGLVTASFSNCSENTNMSWFFSPSLLICPVLSSHFIFLPPLPTSLQLRSFPPLLHSHLLRTGTFRYDQSDYIRALQWEAARKRETETTEKWGVPGHLTFPLLHFYTIFPSDTQTPSPLGNCPHCSEGQTKVVYSTVKTCIWQIEERKKQDSVCCSPKKDYKISIGAVVEYK